MKRVAVLGAGGFIGTHLVRYLKKRDYWVRGVDIKHPKWSKSEADEFYLDDLRKWNVCYRATSQIDEVYQLAADMGGMGFITGNNVDILHNNSLINIYTIRASRLNKVEKYLFSSSACVYPINKLEKIKSELLKEEDSYPALPQKGYGWEKLVHEIRCRYYAEEDGLETKVVRFGNCYGPEGEYDGGREKAPAALCRKVAMAKDGGTIEVWGDGRQTRTFMYIDDCLEGIHKLMQSDFRGPVNLAGNELISINDLAKLIIKISGKKLKIKHIEGPQGVRSRREDTSLAKKRLQYWETKVSLENGISKTYEWIAKQVSKGT